MSHSRRRRTGIGLAAAGVLLSAGVGTALLSGGPPSASATERLPAFADCEQLRQWYVEATLPLVGPYGLDHGHPALTDAWPLNADVAQEGSRSPGLAQVDAVGSGPTGTNVQEAGVDEPDLAKTDGRTLYRVQGRRLVIVDVSGASATRLARLPLPGGRHERRELLLSGDTVLVVSTPAQWAGFGPADLRVAPWPAAGPARTRLVTVDVSVPAAPRVSDSRTFDGELVAARDYGGGTVRLVLRDAGRPALDFVTPNRNRTEREATQENRRRVRASVIGDWLPGVRDADGRRRPLLECTAVRHPEEPAGPGTLSVVTLDPEAPAELDAVAVTAAGDLVYSSVDRLYVATSGTTRWLPQPWESDRPGPTKPGTQVHAFALDGTGTRYVASGDLPGSVRDRWSFDEHDGRLRVASALGDPWRPRENAVSVLEEDGDTLRLTGRVTGLGPDESIQSVRWFGDLAVVVTYRQTDPLYTLDLSDPEDPRVVGALKILGFSGYLHPVGEDQLLGLGRDATAQGVDRGAQAALFDLTDLAAVERTDAVGLRGPAGFTAVGDPRAFTYLPEQRLALAGVTDWETGRPRLVALRVGEDGTLSLGRSWYGPRGHRLDGYPQALRALPLGEGRVALVAGGVRIVDVG